MDGSRCHFVSTATDKHALRHLEGIVGSIFQTTVLEDGTLATDDWGDLFAVECSDTLTSLNLIIKVQYHRTIGTYIVGTFGRITAHQLRHLFCTTGKVCQYEDFCNRCTVVVTGNAHLLRRTVGHPADIHAILIVGIFGKLELLRTIPATCRRIELTNLGKVYTID